MKKKKPVEIIDDFVKETFDEGQAEKKEDGDKIRWGFSFPVPDDIKGIIPIVIDLSKHDDYEQIKIIGFVGSIPDENILPLYYRCLMLNTELINSCFCIYQDQIAIISKRPTKELDSSEFESMFLDVVNNARASSIEFKREFSIKLIEC